MGAYRIDCETCIGGNHVCWCCGSSKTDLLPLLPDAPKWQNYDRKRIEQYISSSDQMIDDDNYRDGFNEGITCALDELDMMIPQTQRLDLDGLPFCSTGYAQRYHTIGECDCKVSLDPSDPFNQRINYLEGKNKSSIELPVTLTLAQKGWEYAQMLSDKEKDENLFGKLVEDHNNGYKLQVQVWKGDWLSDLEPIELKVKRVSSWMLSDWNNDEDGGHGLLITSTFESPSGKTYTFNVVIPKDELIKALASLVRD